MGIWHSVCSTVDAVKYVCGSISDAVKYACGLIADAVKEACELIADAVKYACRSIADAVKKACGFIADAVKYACESIADAVKYAFESIGSALYSAEDRARSGATYIFNLVAGIFRGSYYHGVSAASDVDRPVRDEGVKWTKESVPDEELLGKIRYFAWGVVDQAIDTYIRKFPGGLLAYKIVKEELFKKYVKGVDRVTTEELLRRLKRLEHVVFGSEVHS